MHTCQSRSCLIFFLWADCGPAEICHSLMSPPPISLQGIRRGYTTAFPCQVLMTMLRLALALPCLCYFSHRKLDPVPVGPPHTKPMILKASAVRDWLTRQYSGVVLLTF